MGKLALSQNSPLNNEPHDKRASFANNSFRQATGQPQQHPPQVPPKPTSSSRERLKESIEEVNNLDQVILGALLCGYLVKCGSEFLIDSLCTVFS